MKNYYINSNKWKPFRSHKDKGLEELKKLFRMFKNMTVEEYKKEYQKFSNFEYYSMMQYPNQGVSPAVIKIKCLSCGRTNIEGNSNYCPNCGIKFNKEK